MVSSRQPAMRAHSASRSLPDACAVEVIATRTPLPCERVGDALVVGGNPHFARTGGERATRDMQHQRFASEQAQRFAGQARGRVTRGNRDDEIGIGWLDGHHCESRKVESRSSSATQKASGNSALTGTLKCRAVANAAHFTASFSVISTGRSLPNWKSACHVAMVVGECVRDDRDAHCAQHAEEPLGITDAGDRMHALAGERATAPARARRRSGPHVRRAGASATRRSPRRSHPAPVGGRLTTRKSQRAARATGSRSGPAGSSRPLP